MLSTFYQHCVEVPAMRATWRPQNRNQSNSIYATSTFQILTGTSSFCVSENCASPDVSHRRSAPRGHEKSRKYTSTRVRIIPDQLFFSESLVGDISRTTWPFDLGSSPLCWCWRTAQIKTLVFTRKYFRGQCCEKKTVSTHFCEFFMYNWQPARWQIINHSALRALHHSWLGWTHFSMRSVVVNSHRSATLDVTGAADTASLSVITAETLWLMSNLSLIRSLHHHNHMGPYGMR